MNFIKSFQPILLYSVMLKIKCTIDTRIVRDVIFRALIKGKYAWIDIHNN